MPSATSLPCLLPLSIEIREYPPAHVLPPSRFRHFELIWPLEGSADYRSSGRHASLHPRAILLRPRGGVDAFLFDKTRGTRLAAAAFRLSRIPPAWPPLQKWPLSRDLPEGDLLRPLFRHLLTHRDALDHRTDLPLIRQTLSLMLHLFVSGRLGTLEPAKPIYPRPVRRILALLRAQLVTNPNRRLSKDQIGRAAGMHPGSALRLFRQHVGHPPMTYFRLARLERAADLLRQTDEPLESIASIMGFCNWSHLSLMIHRHFGLTPKQFRALSTRGLLPPLAPLISVDPLSIDPTDLCADPELQALPSLPVAGRPSRKTGRHRRGAGILAAPQPILFPGAPM